MGVLAICDRDESYVRCFAEYFSVKGRVSFSICGFSKERELLDFVNRTDIDILLISGSMLSDRIREADGIAKIIVLSDGGMLSESVLAPEYDSIFKFQSTENIIREVMEYYSEIHRTEEGVLSDMAGSDVWGVYSPASRCGKTTFAIALGQALARKYRTLYIDMDEFSGFETLCGRKISGDLSDVLYYQKLNPSGLNIKLKAVVNNIHGLDVVAPMSFSSDLRNIDFAQWKELIDYVSNRCGYDKVILDINSAVKNPIDVLSLCGRVYMPVPDDMISNAKVREFEHFLIKSGNEQILFNIQKIKPPLLKNVFMQPGYMDKLMISDMGGFAEMLLEGGDTVGDGGDARTGYITDRDAY